MTTENQTTIIPTIDSNSKNTVTSRLSSKLEERRGNAVKPLSLRPTRSVKKNTSLKPTGLKTR